MQVIDHLVVHGAAELRMRMQQRWQSARLACAAGESALRGDLRGRRKMISGMEKPYTGMTGWFRAGLVSRAQLWARSGLAPEKRLNHAGVFLTFMI